MSAKLNKIQLIGRLGKDPEMAYVGKDGDKARTKVSVAVDRPYPGEGTDWFNVVCFGKTAEFVNQYGAKGRRVLIEGVMQNNRWEDQEGNTRDWWEVVAKDVQFLDYEEE